MKSRSRLSRREDPNVSLSPGLTEAIRLDLIQLCRQHNDEFDFSYLEEECFSKYVGPETDPAEVRRQRAIDKWLATELRNELTNSRLLMTYPEEEILPGVSYGRFMDFVRATIRRLLPTDPSMEVLFGTFSGGASTSKSRMRSHPAQKFLDKADVTPSAWAVIKDLIDDCPVWKEHIHNSWQEPRFVDGNVLFTVAKSTTIDRCAAKEPDLNMFVQKGIGNFLRKRLRLFGINLNDQSVNAKLAKQGSIDNQLMTLDLSSASDSVSTQLVFECLPESWFLLMDAVRSPITVIDGVPHENHMFSSMGNGFTFELESLIFWACARAVSFFTGTRGPISVYGDDIIMPSSCYEQMNSALTYLGFQVNPDKSHYGDSHFRESCGSHWYKGIDVTPIYVKRPIERVVDLIHFLNGLVRWASKGFYKFTDPRIDELWLKYARYVPPMLWGGQDMTSITSLVSGDRPRKELLLRTKPQDQNHMGGYLYWLRTAHNRTGPITDPLIVSEMKRDVGSYKLRRNAQPVDENITFNPFWVTECSSDSEMSLLPG